MINKLEDEISVFMVSSEEYAYFDQFTTDDLTLFIEKSTYNIEKLNDLSSESKIVYKIDNEIYLGWDDELMIAELFKKIPIEFSHDVNPDLMDTSLYSIAFADHGDFFDKYINPDINVVISFLSKFLNLPNYVFDFSDESLEIIDSKVELLIELNQEKLATCLLPLSIYLGEVYNLKHPESKWQIELNGDKEYYLPILKISENKSINILKLLFDSFTGDFGVVIPPSRIISILQSDIFGRK